jgi:hypothetical protein
MGKARLLVIKKPDCQGSGSFEVLQRTTMIYIYNLITRLKSGGASGGKVQGNPAEDLQVRV